MIESKSDYYIDEKMFHGFLPQVMGTKFDILVFSNNEFLMNEMWTRIIEKLESLDDKLNRFNPDSEVSTINSTPYDTWVNISEEMLYILNVCYSYYIKTFHLFDITINNYSAVEIDNDLQLVKRGDKSNLLDFGGFAKGYALSKISTILDSYSINDCFVNFGNSSIMGKGHHPYGDCWKVSIPNPYTGITLSEFNLKNSSLSVSGNTDTHTGHIFNINTSQYDFDKRIVSIESKDPLDAEILSTALMIADDVQRKEIMRNFKNIHNRIFTI